jgi:TPR repeat protein
VEPYLGKPLPRIHFSLYLCLYTEVSPGKAVYWYTKAANQGYAESQFNLSGCYMAGLLEVKKDEVQAFAWCRKAAALGSAPAQHNMVGTDV